MLIDISDTESAVLCRYGDHLWNTAQINLDMHECIHRLIAECGEELDVIQADLRAEDGVRGSG